MGNEIMSQNLPNYGYLNPMTNMGMQMPMGMNTGMFNPAQMSVNNYADDMFAPDFIKQMNFSGFNTNKTQNNTNQSIFTNTQNQAQQTYPQTFTGSTEEEQSQQQSDKKEEDIPKTNIGKTTGAIAGLSIPLLSPLSKVISGAKFSDVFKFKELGLKAFALAVAGWCAGSLIDGFINNNRTQRVSA